MDIKEINEAKNAVWHHGGEETIMMLEWLAEEPGDNSLTPIEVMALTVLMLRDSEVSEIDAVFEVVCDKDAAQEVLAKLTNIRKAYEIYRADLKSRISSSIDWIQNASEEEYLDFLKDYYERFRFEFTEEEWKENHPKLFTEGLIVS